MRRRTFLASVAAGAATSAVSYGRVLGSNNRVRVGLIGCGVRGRYVAERMAAAPDVQFVVACDVYDANAGRARDWAGEGCAAESDFRRVLDQADVDAVLVATPDHWHAIPTVLACAAGKDVYVEKPLAHSIGEGRAMVDAARRHDRVVQHGTQHRSAEHYRVAQQIVQSGDLGRVHFVRVWNYANRFPGGYRRDDSPSMQPAGLDWDFYLGPAPQVPYDRRRFLGSFRYFYDYAGGYVTDWGTHRFDSVRQILGEANPTSVSATGGRYALGAGGDTPDVIAVHYAFPDFTLAYEAIQTNGHGAGGRTPGMRYYQMRGEHDRPHGVAIFGTNGSLFVDRIGLEVYPEFEPKRGADGAPRRRMERRTLPGADATAEHAANFIECVRTRKQPNADVAIGHASSIVPHLGNIAYRSGTKVDWNSQDETIAENPAAAALLIRAARAPWNIVEGT